MSSDKSVALAVVIDKLAELTSPGNRFTFHNLPGWTEQLEDCLAKLDTVDLLHLRQLLGGTV
jgi:hypothetical protein